jgi:endonuclease-3
MLAAGVCGLRRIGEAALVPRASQSDKATRIVAILDELFPRPPIPLEHRDPFTLLVAVMLSAQTTDKKVNQVTPQLFALADTPAAMAALPVEQILAAIREVGLAPTKARNLKALSQLLVDRHGGVVPSDEAALEALPGVGHKTASVVRAQAFGIPSFPVDTHIHRLAERWGLSSGRNVETTERDLKAMFAERLWNKLHLQIIYFGREHCPARGHEVGGCPICSWAGAGVPSTKTRTRTSTSTSTSTSTKTRTRTRTKTRTRTGKKKG